MRSSTSRPTCRWLTGRALSDFALDRHLSLPADPYRAGGLQSASLINQAIGVLIGRGYTPEQAEFEIDARAAAAGHSRSDAADIILSSPPFDEVDPAPEAR